MKRQTIPIGVLMAIFVAMITKEGVLAKFPDRITKKILFTEPEKCWEWSKHIKYPKFRWEGKEGHAHRIIYLAMYGIDRTNFQVCHKCDNVYCVNPNHMFLGTQQENVWDMHYKGRWQQKNIHRGTSHVRNKLTEEQVREIYRRAHNKESSAIIAREHGVSVAMIHKIRNGTRWNHLFTGEANKKEKWKIKKTDAYKARAKLHYPESK